VEHCGPSTSALPSPSSSLLPKPVPATMSKETQAYVNPYHQAWAETAEDCLTLVSAPGVAEFWIQNKKVDAYEFQQAHKVIRRTKSSLQAFSRKQRVGRTVFTALFVTCLCSTLLRSKPTVLVGIT